MKTLTQTQIAEQLDCSIRTVQRDLMEFGIMPVEIKGREQLYEPSSIDKMLAAKREKRLKAVAANRGIVLPDMKHLRSERTRATAKAGAR